MSDYFDILKHMPLSTTNSVINMNPDGVAPDIGLTVEKLEQMWRNLQRLGPPPPEPAFDLFGNPYITEMYELNLQQTLPELMPLFQPRGRRTLIVPKDRLAAVAQTLREAGADVRVEPRYGTQSVETQPGEPT